MCVCVRKKEREREREIHLLILPHFHSRILIPEVLEERVKHVVKGIHDLGSNYERYTEKIKHLEERKSDKKTERE